MRFDSYHPLINLIFFAAAIGCALCFRHPVFLVISFVCAFAYSVKLNGLKALVFNLVLCALLAVFAFWYAYYHHFGVTTLHQNIIGNQITFEALVYGFVLAAAVAAVIMWISCLHAIFTADKVVYLLGRLSPHLSLFVSIILRMVPRLKARTRQIHVAQRGIGRGVGDGPFFRRVINLIRLISIVITWLLENLIESAASMRCRGYGLKGRTAFSIYRFDRRDRTLVIVFFACLSLILGAAGLNQTSMQYDPQIVFRPVTRLSIVFYVAYALFLSLPLILQIVGERRFAALSEMQ